METTDFTHFKHFGASKTPFEIHLDALPQEAPCPRHPDTLARLDRAKTERKHTVYACEACAAEAAARKRLKRLNDAHIPHDAEHATLENFRTDRGGINPLYQTPAQFLQACQSFAAGEVRNLILGGTPGIGKGHLGAALSIPYLDSGRSVVWYTCSDLFFDYHASYATGTTVSLLREFQCPDLLVLDEIALRDLPADGEEILFAIIDARHQQKISTILLGNKPADESRLWLGGRISDRLRSGGLAFRYGEWDSMRGGECDGAGF